MGREYGDNNDNSRHNEGERDGYSGGDKFHQDAYKMPESKQSYNPSNQVENKFNPVVNPSATADVNFHPTVNPNATARSSSEAAAMSTSQAAAQNKTEVANTSNITNGQSLDSQIKSNNQNQSSAHSGDANVSGYNSYSSTTIKNFAAPNLGAPTVVGGKCTENTYGGVSTIFGGANGGHMDVSTECLAQERVEKFCDQSNVQTDLALKAIALADGMQGDAQKAAAMKIANRAANSAMNAEAACYTKTSEDDELVLPPIVIQKEAPPSAGNANFVTQEQLNLKLDNLHRSSMQK